MQFGSKQFYDDYEAAHQNSEAAKVRSAAPYN
jgi:hypothetical protein